MKNLVFICCIITFVGACIPFKNKDYSYFYLSARDSNCTNKDKITIFIKEVVVLRPYNRKEIFYSIRPYEIKNYIYNKWAAPLPDLIYNTFLSYNGCVTYSHNYKNAKYLLKLKVRRFLHKIDSKDKSHVEVSIDFYLTDTSSSNLILKKSYNMSEPCTENTPFGAVKAFNNVISNILIDFEQKIISSLNRHQS